MRFASINEKSGANGSNNDPICRESENHFVGQSDFDRGEKTPEK